MVVEEPIRGLVVRYVRQTRCPSDVAVVTVDVEPAPPGAEGLSFTNDVDDIPPDYVTALWEATESGLSGTGLTATIRLRQAGHHEVDSRPLSFTKAGEQLADLIRSRLG